MARFREPGRQDRPTAPRGPVRTCVGCRSRESASDLLRVVAVDGELVPDPRRRSPGRGAWLHPDTGCLHRAERRSAFPRALRVPGPLGAGAVRALLEDQVRAGSRADDRRDDPIALVPGSRSTPDEPAVKHSR